ncbi:hypothetical protein AGMMS49949_02940 [Alphaproteobacteria bacterium]|nr:hypothetical protein AGMMS49949_02940 [Alphaproteobacteria bacterium]GHS96135.1 hypothetical protein AGMMS50296_1990 [Alphaproteobacteria bacterium]
MQIKRILLGSLGSCALLGLAGCDPQNKLSDGQKKEVEDLVTSVVIKMLDNEPERFVVAIDKAIQKQQQQAAQRIETAATENQQKFWGSKLILGNKDAKLRLAVFFDPLDATSQRFYSTVMAPIVKERSDVGFFLIPVSIYGGDAAQSEPTSVTAAQAVIAAMWQNPAMALALWAKMPPIDKEFPRAQLLQCAKDVGLDSDRLENDLKSDAAKNGLIENGQLAVKVGIPLRMPIIFVRKNDGTLEMLPAFLKDKLAIVLDAIRDDKPWPHALGLEAAPPADGAASAGTAPAVPAPTGAPSAAPPEADSEPKAEAPASASSSAPHPKKAGKRAA